MRIGYSLKDALTWRFMAVSILPLLVASLLTFDYFTRETAHRLERENFSTAESIAAHVSLELQEPLVLVREFSQLASSLNLADPVVSDYLDEIVRRNGKIDSIFLLDRAGVVIATGLPDDFRVTDSDFLNQDFSLLPQVRQARNTKGLYWSKAFYSQLNGSITVALTSPLADGLLIAYINIEKLHQRVMPMLAQRASQLLIFDRQGRLFFQYPQTFVAEAVDTDQLQPVKAALEGATETSDYELWGQTFLGTAVQVPEVDWIVLFGQEHSGATNVLWRLRTVISTALFALILASLWARGLARKIVRPISDLAQSAESFAEGDYRYPLPYGNHHEIDCLSDSFRSMRQTIDEREKLLLQSKEYFSRLFNGVTDAILISKRNHDGTPGNFIEVNDVACKLLGYEREQFRLLSPNKLNRICKEEPSSFQLILDELSADEQVLFKTELLTVDGSWIPVEIGCQLFELDGQQVFFSVARDITLREKYETSIKALVRSTVGLTGQDCLDEIVQNLCDWLSADAASIGIVAGDRLNIQSSFINGEHRPPFSLQLSGTPYEAILEGEFCSYAEDVSSRFPALSQFKLTSIKSFIGIPMVGYDGRIIGVVSAFSRSALIAVPHVEELLSVIASRAAAEYERLDYVRELSHSEEKLRTIFNSTAEAIVGLDLRGHCVFCNPSALQMLGCENESELIGQPFVQLLDNEKHFASEGEEVVSPISLALESEGSASGADGTLLCKAGREIPVEYWGHRMMRDGELIGGVITFIDISRRRTLEKQLHHSQRMEAIGTLTGGIAHDFNNILTVISGYAGLLQSVYAKDVSLLSKISKIAEAADRGSKLTHGLLAYSRKKSGPSTPVDLNRLVLQVQELFGKVIGEHIDKQLTLSEQQLIVLADTPQLEQVLVNLATNARDAMTGGGVLSIKTTRAEIDKDFCAVHGYGEPGEYALITVEDTGIGMSRDILQNIFDPFYTTKDTGKGTGLGLAIAWGIIKQHKGYVLVDSEQGRGSCFRIYLPLTGRKPHIGYATESITLPGGDETILLVEDDPQVLESTYNILSSVGYQVVTSTCADSALQTLDENSRKIEMILSDVVMPGIKGSAFYREIRKRTDVPVIFISGYTFDALRDQGLVDDDSVLLNKPISPHNLLTRLREAFAGKKARA